ncbi:NADP-dependent oxidoreductase [Streptomyces montanisoli]|uniref:NADP-dependent oxidoreductase n=1 Tax=Streptomyces montanisoli TaxID=2798581 RepID=A0A940S144_9ACTN|nr:NADP-dependent oxidoreductase [Streptomyces montanisoli]MBP0461574.1 NADP-dependent oxidoreductase [Streptomyces montanisoli]
MKATVFEEFGGPEVLHMGDVDEPHAGPGQVRVRVKAAGVNPMDWKIRHGWMQEVMPAELPSVPGLEAAGVVDEVGEGVTDLAVGDEVVGSAVRAYAEHALMTVAVKKPAGLDWNRAVALPVAGETASRVLGALGVEKGETLLVHGAAGAVGAIAVQFAIARGATVIGTASPANHDYVSSLGATPIAYGDGLVERVRAAAPQGVDAVFDTAGKGALPDSIELRGGTTDRVITIADMAAQQLGVVFSGGGSTPEQRRSYLTDALALAAEGALDVRVARTYTLAEAAEAHAESEAGHARGKLVIVP